MYLHPSFFAVVRFTNNLPQSRNIYAFIEDTPLIFIFTFQDREARFTTSFCPGISVAAEL
jgi:hypothetical protein